LNKKNEVSLEITRLGGIVCFVLISVVLILIFINSKPTEGEYEEPGEDYQSIKVFRHNEYM
jgi:NADH-quinone oxidoreductase subunit J